ncbi:MAG: hypothetical protein SF123_26595 [Chloroflexota bacterium]|nr:hypothetical protein [Chloroflexota bacterium]
MSDQPNTNTPPPVDAVETPVNPAPPDVQSNAMGAQTSAPPQDAAPAQPAAPPAQHVAPLQSASDAPRPEGEEMGVRVPPAQPPSMPEDEGYRERLERLGGEPAPVITPEEFARLQRQGQVNIDARGRVRTTRRSDAEAGVSLRKRRAWYRS